MSYKRKRYVVNTIAIISFFIFVSFSYAAGKYCGGTCHDGDYWYISEVTKYSFLVLGFCFLFYFFTGVSWYAYGSGDRILIEKFEKSALSVFVLKNHRPGGKDD